MELFEIVFIGIGLAMDAFAVSVCKGLSMKKIDWKNAIIIAIYTGWLIAYAARAIATIPMIKTSIEAKVDTLVTFDINPIIPNAIIINPTI